MHPFRYVREIADAMGAQFERFQAEVLEAH